MCKKTVVVVAPKMMKKEQIHYERQAKEKMLDGENGKKLIFIHPQESWKLANGNDIKKVVFVTQGYKNEVEIITAVKKAVTKINKGNTPVYLRLSSIGDDRFDCVGINNLKYVRHFESIEDAYQKVSDKDLV
ncbi:MAG: hypothetical protein JJE53_03070 [Candidatus Pacebacteria bacterium]|nr:hypothetical protein [Candidatus Paceibacterota bacterium]